MKASPPASASIRRSRNLGSKGRRIGNLKDRDHQDGNRVQQHSHQSEQSGNTPERPRCGETRETGETGETGDTGNTDNTDNTEESVTEMVARQNPVAAARQE